MTILAATAVWVVVTGTAIQGAHDGRCSTDLDCALNGDCQNGQCHCRPPWTAVPNCSVLAFAEPRLRGEAYQGFGTDISSWGGSVAYDPTDGLFHMFVAEMANHCGLETWHPNSRVVHATSPTAEGPYTRVQVVLGHYAHGPSVARDPVTGTWVLTHLGTGLPDPTPRPIPGVAGVTLHYCVNGNSYNTSNKSYPTIPGLPPPPPPPPPSPLPLPLLPAGSEWMLFADSPFGPWRNGIKAPNPGANSVPLFYPNGSVLVAQQGLSKSGPTNCTAGVPGGCTNGSGFLNWVYAESVAALENGDFVAHGAADITVTPWTHWEDVFMWVDQIGNFHALFHAVLEHWENASYSQAIVGGHAFSTDGLRWHAGKRDAYGHEVTYKGGAEWVMTERERPHLLFDSSGAPTHLFNGVCPFAAYAHVNDHSFTQCLPLVTNAS